MNAPGSTTEGIRIRTDGRAGRITLDRPRVLNALSPEMGHAIDRALCDWADDESVALVILDASGDKAFCSGGDIEGIYRRGLAGDYGYARDFWRDEYRMNARIARYPKPVVAFMQGYVMGGGVGVGCHASHRIACESTRIAMPECGIGLVPDVGGSLLLAGGPGRLGEYLGTTATRMDAADAIHVGFADRFVPAGAWPDLIARLAETGEAGLVDEAAGDPGESALAAQAERVDALFAGDTLADIVQALEADGGDFARAALKALSRVSPLAAATAVALIRLSRDAGTIEAALGYEFRATWRAIEEGDFLEGIRAAIIDKDRTPRWRYDTVHAVPQDAVDRMLAPLGPDALNLERTP